MFFKCSFTAKHWFKIIATPPLSIPRFVHVDWTVLSNSYHRFSKGLNVEYVVVFAI